MSRPPWDDDVRLLLDLGGALDAASAVPTRIADIGRAAFVWRTVDAELAELTFDSATDAAGRPGGADPGGEAEAGGEAGSAGGERDTLPDGALAGTRASVARLRAMTFTASDLTIELEVADDGLVGQVVPAQPGLIELRSRDGAAAQAAEADAVGWFVLRPRPTGTFQLHVRLSGTDRREIVTEWFVL
ncbi:MULTISPECIES: hypothetical protein [unclassified Pseudofrankia]|uniref:hypothetical protein n=1 Tax=unclassified Pseudofrankia TaxID=2994372 RepID=UPI0008DB2D55|nr:MULTISPECIES: hypothetical protein [unclassified Pseudofrankia]MDT3439388.1 hypothetical protein [Pseudofrankia sp. BMG5.37]OHV65028.1 hypothetical protein BCD48_36745 [Pseudofrankia sp. BMG5.36]